MKLARAAQEYARFPVDGAPSDAAPLEVSFDGGPWNEMRWEPGNTSASVLVSGPDVPNPDGVVLKAGRNVPAVRLTDTPEVVIRSTGGSIDVT